MSIFISPAGHAVTPRRRPERTAALTREQLDRLRNEDWRRAHDEGVMELDGKVRRRSVRLLARLSGRSQGTIRQGIASARLIRKALAHALDRD